MLALLDFCIVCDFPGPIGMRVPDFLSFFNAPEVVPFCRGALLSFERELPSGVRHSPEDFERERALFDRDPLRPVDGACAEDKV